MPTFKTKKSKANSSASSSKAKDVNLDVYIMDK